MRKLYGFPDVKVIRKRVVMSIGKEFSRMNLIWLEPERDATVDT